MWAQRQIILIFYRPLFVLNITFSLLALKFIAINGWGVVLLSVLIKLIGYVAGIGYQYYFLQKTFFYYRNSGVAVRKLYLWTFGFDLMIYGLMLMVYCLISK